MFGTCSFGHSLSTLLLAWVLGTQMSKAEQPFSCTGGSIYIVAHPADVLLYHNPDLYHDFYVYKCITTVFFTSGDRGISSNFSKSLEHGLEMAYSQMAGVSTKDSDWAESEVELDNKRVVLRSHKNAPQIQVLYLRLPDGGPDGSGYRINHGGSLKKLYDGDVKTLSTIEEGQKYTIDSLGDLISVILKKRKANYIRVLDFKASIPDRKNCRYCDQADHVVSARLVRDALEKNKIQGKLQSFAGSFMRSLNPTMNASNLDFKIKAEVLFEYAKYDDHMCKDYDKCLAEAKQSSHAFQDQDVQYVSEWLQREYYVS